MGRPSRSRLPTSSVSPHCGRRGFCTAGRTLQPLSTLRRPSSSGRCRRCRRRRRRGQRTRRNAPRPCFPSYFWNPLEPCCCYSYAGLPQAAANVATVSSVLFTASGGGLSTRPPPWHTSTATATRRRLTIEFYQAHRFALCVYGTGDARV